MVPGGRGGMKNLLTEMEKEGVLGPEQPLRHVFE